MSETLRPAGGEAAAPAESRATPEDMIVYFETMAQPGKKNRQWRRTAQAAWGVLETLDQLAETQRQGGEIITPLHFWPGRGRLYHRFMRKATVQLMEMTLHVTDAKCLATHSRQVEDMTIDRTLWQGQHRGQTLNFIEVQGMDEDRGAYVIWAASTSIPQDLYRAMQADQPKMPFMAPVGELPAVTTREDRWNKFFDHLSQEKSRRRQKRYLRTLESQNVTDPAAGHHIVRSIKERVQDSKGR